MSEDIVSAVFPDDTDPDDLSAEVAELRSALDQAVAKIEALEADMHNQTDVANRAVNDLRAEIDGKADSELFVPTESVIPDLDIDIDGTNDKDWAHPDSQFTVPTSNSIEQEYSTDGTKNDMLKLYQFLTGPTSTLAVADKVLVRHVLSGVPTLQYAELANLPVITDMTVSAGVITFTRKQVKVLQTPSDLDAQTITLIKKTIVSNISVGAGEPDNESTTQLKQQQYDAYVLAPVNGATAIDGTQDDIIAIEGCD